MRVVGFEWDSGSVAKCQKHGVTLQEIEGLFDRRVLIVDDPLNATIERRFRAIGTTSEGRPLSLVFTLRNDRIRALSARYMHKREVERYEEDNADV